MVLNFHEKGVFSVKSFTTGLDRLANITATCSSLFQVAKVILTLPFGIIFSLKKSTISGQMLKTFHHKASRTSPFSCPGVMNAFISLNFVQQLRMVTSGHQ